MNWIWVLSFTVLGSGEHGTMAKYKTKEECHRALELKITELASKGKTAVGQCHMRSEAGKGWW